MAIQKGLTKETLSMDMAKMKILGDLSTSNYYYLEIGPLYELGDDETVKADSFFSSQGQDDAYQFAKRDMRLLCSEAVLPASAYATAEVKDNYMGVTQQFAHTRMYTDIDLTFYIDKSYRANMYFETWMDYIGGGSPLAMDEMQPFYFRRLHYPDSYKTNNIKIHKFERDLNRKENITLRYQLKNAFPKALSSTTVSYGPAELLRVTVTLGYDYYSVTKNKPKGTQESFREPLKDQLKIKEPANIIVPSVGTQL